VAFCGPRRSYYRHSRTTIAELEHGWAKTTRRSPQAVFFQKKRPEKGGNATLLTRAGWEYQYVNIVTGSWMEKANERPAVIRTATSKCVAPTRWVGTPQLEPFLKGPEP
jgi:hypothetical protein